MSAYDYWNDVNIEKRKEFWLEDASDMKLVRYLKDETNLERCFQDALSLAKDMDCFKGRILDIGAGVCWASAIVSAIPSVEKVVALDFSRHRLTKIAPLVFKQLKGDADKFNTILGDFLHTEFEAESFNVVMFVQALYMFPDLKQVLRKVNKLLTADGLLLVACERLIPECADSHFESYKRKIRRLIKGKSDISGNCGYVDSEYRNAIKKCGFNYRFQLLDYPLFPKNSEVAAGNHFGIKV